MLNAFGSITGKKALCKYVPLKVENIIPLTVDIDNEFIAIIISKGNLISFSITKADKLSNSKTKLAVSVPNIVTFSSVKISIFGFIAIMLSLILTKCSILIVNLKITSGLKI
jgi:hypothetical protein